MQEKVSPQAPMDWFSLSEMVWSCLLSAEKNISERVTWTVKSRQLSSPQEDRVGVLLVIMRSTPSALQGMRNGSSKEPCIFVINCYQSDVLYQDVCSAWLWSDKPQRFKHLIEFPPRADRKNNFYISVVFGLLLSKYLLHTLSKPRVHQSLTHIKSS